MSDSPPIYKTHIDATCAMRDCTDQSEIVCIVAGALGEDCLAGYCEEHATLLADDDSHTPIGEVER